MNRNAQYGSVALNDALQGDVCGADRNLRRWLLNSIVGLGGIFDVASAYGLPEERNSFERTLTHWGVGVGPKANLPWGGEISPGGVASGLVTAATNPATWLAPWPVTLTLRANSLARGATGRTGRPREVKSTECKAEQAAPQPRGSSGVGN